MSTTRHLSPSLSSTLSPIDLAPSKISFVSRPPIVRHWARNRAADGITSTTWISKSSPIITDSSATRESTSMCPSCQFHGRAEILGVPSRFEVMGDADQVQQFTGYEINHLADGRRIQVEAGVGGTEDDARVAEGLVVVDIDGRQRHLAVDEDEAAALLE